MLRPRSTKQSDLTPHDCSNCVMVGVAKHRPYPHDLKFRGVERLYQRQPVIHIMLKPFSSRRIGINPGGSAPVSVWSGPNWQD